MDSEVDAEPDEQDGERDRNKVELANAQGRETGGPDQPHD